MDALDCAVQGSPALRIASRRVKTDGPGGVTSTLGAVCISVRAKAAGNANLFGLGKPRKTHLMGRGLLCAPVILTDPTRNARLHPDFGPDSHPAVTGHLGPHSG